MPRADDRGTATRPGVIAGPDVTSAVPDALAIETRDLHKSFGSHDILKGANVRIPEGSASAILGPSGTGKSVLLQHVIGVMKPDAGEVLIRGRNIAEMGRGELLDLRTDIGVMFQDGALFSSMSVYDNVAFSLRQHTDLREPAVHDLVMEQLIDVGLEAAKDRYPSELSGGMRKRAGLARALVLEPSILLCDEPDSGLDPVRTSLLGELLQARHEYYGGTLVVVTHNIPLARQVSDHMTLVWQGQVVADGASAGLLESDDPFVRQFLAGDSVGPLGMD